MPRGYLPVHRPAHGLPGIRADDNSQTQPTFSGMDAGDVAQANLIGSSHGKLPAQKIAGDR